MLRDPRGAQGLAKRLHKRNDRLREDVFQRQGTAAAEGAHTTFLAHCSCIVPMRRTARSMTAESLTGRSRVSLCMAHDPRYPFGRDRR